MLFAIIPAAALLILLFLIAPYRPSKKKTAPFFHRNVAHRGLYTKDQTVPENSLAAFERAVENGYGTELDVQLSKDGEVVVFHDGDLKRMCGLDKKVDELTFEELKTLSLKDTGEKIPLFSEVLELTDGRIPMIVEIKTCKNRKELCEKTLALLKNYKGEYCVESFDPFIVGYFRFHAPEILRGQLASPPRVYKKGGMPSAVGFLLGNTLLNFIARPNFIAYEIGKIPLLPKTAYLLGAYKIAWTSHDEESEKHASTVIFEHYLPKTRY